MDETKNQQEHAAEENKFTKEQQDAYFDNDSCPSCRSQEILVGRWDCRDSLHFRVRAAFCDDCDEEWFEAHYRYAGPHFLLKPTEVDEFFEEACGDLEDEDHDTDGDDIGNQDCLKSDLGKEKP